MRPHRRELLLALGCLSGQAFFGKAAAQAGSFDSELAEVLANTGLLEQTQNLDREDAELPLARGTVKSRISSTRSISDRAIKLIIGFEVTSQSVYEKKYQGAIRPGGQSGITIGIGYDIGYVTPEYLREDWDDYLSSSDIERLSKACNVKGPNANSLLPQMSDIKVPWEKADAQFRKKVLPFYVGATLNALMNADQLSGDSLGALVSLVYNRGPSFQATGGRYEEMRRIKRLMLDRQYDLVPEQFEAMKRLWTTPDVIGVATRRHLEALLFREGLR